MSSFFARAHDTFLFLLHTPLIPPPDHTEAGGRQVVEMTPMDRTGGFPGFGIGSRFGLASSSSASPANTPAQSPVDAHATSPFDSIQSSIELDPSQAKIIREMLEDAMEPAPPNK